MLRLVETPQNTLSERATSRLLDLIHASIKKDENYFRGIKRDRDLLKGEHWKNLKQAAKEQVKMVVNLAHAHISSLLPTIFFKEPTVDAYPSAPIYEGKEDTWNNLLNNTITKINFAEEVKKVAFDSVTFPEGVFKWVLNLPEEENFEDKKTEDTYRGPTVWLDKGSPVPVRHSPAQLIVDYLAPDRDLDKARFIALRYRRTLAELRAHPVYKKNLPLEHKKTGTTKQPSISQGEISLPDDDDFEYNRTFPLTGENEDIVTIYEVWIHQLIDDEYDLKSYQQMCVLMEEHSEKPLRQLTKWSDIMGEGWDEYPVDRLVLNPVPDSNPKSEVSFWHSLQIAVNWITSRLTQLVESERMIYGVDNSLLKNAARFRKEFLSGRIVNLLEVNGNPNNAVALFQPTFAGRDNYALLNQVMSFIQQVSGFGQNRRGGSGIRTAREALLVEQGTQIKTDEKVETVRRFLRRIIFKLAKLLRIIVAKNKNTEFVYRIAGDTGSINWGSVTAEDLNWMPEIDIRVDSFRKVDSLDEMLKISAILSIAMQMIQLNPSIRVDKIFAELLRRAGIYNVNEIVGDMGEEGILQMVEISALIAEIDDVPVTKEQNHVVHKTMIQSFRNSAVGQAILRINPGVDDALAQHEQLHDQFLEEINNAGAQGSKGINPFDDLRLRGQVETDTSQATSPDRSPLPFNGIP